MADKPTYEELEQRIKELEHVEYKRKRVELKLEDSVKKSRAWLEHSPVCTKIVDLDFNLQYMSSAGVKGLQIDDITPYYGKPYPFDFYPESFRKRMIKNLEKVTETGEIITQEASVVDIEGNELWFHSTLAPVNDEKGRIEYIIVVSIDTTARKQAEMELQKHRHHLEELVSERTIELEKEIDERKQAEKILKQSKDKLNKMFQFTDYMVCIADLKTGYFTKISPAFTRHLGWSEQEMLSEPILDFIHPDDVKKTADIIKKQMEKGIDVIQFENRYKTKKGDFRWLEWAAKPVPEEGITYSAAYDITERKKAEKALQESQEKYRSVVEDVPLLICSFDSDFNITFINEAYVKYFEIKRYEWIGKSFLSLVPEKDRKTVMDNISSLDPQNPVMSHEHKVIAPNGEIHWQRWINRGIFDKMSNLTVYQSLGEDITYQKQAEEENAKLEKQLQQSQKMESIGTLTGGIAHDFNNMLSIILGNTELAMDDVPEWNPARKNLEEIKTGSLRAKNVVKQLLSFSRKTDPKRKPVKISPIIKDTLKFLRSTISTNIEIRKTIPDESGIISADSTQIHQVMMNLCTNAARAMFKNGGIMEVSLSVVEISQNKTIKDIELNQGQYVKITVSDTGHGIIKEHLDRIFDPYFTTKAVGEGSGIGLSVVHGIVKSHDGAISVESEYGKGTTFNVFFPVVEKAPVYEKEADTTVPTGNERILFVDDEKSIVNLTTQMLERLGYTVTAKTSSTDTLETFRTHPDNFDLIISDMSMPEITGDKLAKELLQIKPEVPIIICTGHSERINDEKANSIGVRALVMKPIVKSVLAITIRKVLD